MNRLSWYGAHSVPGTAPSFQRLRWFPNTGIAPVLGFSGTSILWKVMSGAPFTRQVFGQVAPVLNWTFWIIGLTLFTLVVSLYVFKFAVHRDVVIAEFKHPVRAHFFNGPTIAILMLALGMPSEIVDVGFLRGVWLVAGMLQLGLTRIYVFSDGCRSQYKGKKNFVRVAQFPSRIGGIQLVHRFAASNHFKGPHDAYGKDAKHLCRTAERNQKARLASTHQLVNSLPAHCPSSRRPGVQPR